MAPDRPGDRRGHLAGEEAQILSDLEKWQGRLAAHFTELHGLRSSETPDRPVFGLEHGLDSADAVAMARALRAHVATRSPSKDHALVWVAYAAEIGYRYSGDEYWQTFEEETPGWTVHGERAWIRSCFRAFQTMFNGAVPSGPWAEHFSIICWPITHAVLPRDLQRQLARILYELRHSFSAELFASPLTLGELVAARSWNATSRFQHLAQETELVGQIATALLLQGGSATGSLIHPATLKRIGDDLDRERRAREWLRDARRYAESRVQIRGIGLPRGAGAIEVGRVGEARAEASALGIEPRTVLRPMDAAGTSWEVSLEIPDLSDLLFRFPETRAILAGSRCLVAGAAGRPLARGRCLHGAQRVALVRWPNSDDVLLQFEQKDPRLEFLLRTECLLRPGPTWLFRIASDGLAYESRGLRVRPGQRYIVVSALGPVESSNHARAINLACEGIDGALLDVPAALTDEWEKTLRGLGLGQAKTIEVWPAGLAAVAWDGEGHGEWLASERPCLAIRSDHAIATLIVSMANGALEVTPVISGEPVFVELPELPIGVHTVHVCSQRNPGEGVVTLGDLDVIMRIREGRPWSPGVSPHGPLIVQMDPASPTLEQLWEGRVDVRIQGPVGRRVKCKAALFEKDAGVPTVATRLPPLELPLSPDEWRARFDKYFRETRRAQDAYDAARSCEVVFSGEELGAFFIRCEREFAPLRWALRRDGQARLARLIDDSGNTERPTVARMAFEAPGTEERLEPALEYRAPAGGGMYVARTRGSTAAVIVPPTGIGLSNLRCVPRIDGRERSAESVVRALSIARLWGTARMAGDYLSATRQREVLLTLARHTSRVVCGENWARAEEALEAGRESVAGLQRVVSRRHEEGEIGVALARKYSRLATATVKDRVDFVAELATKHLLVGKRPGNAGDPQWLAELVLRLASDPAKVESWAGQDLRAGVGRLLEELPTLARAARFLVVATDRHLGTPPGSGELYASWRWT